MAIAVISAVVHSSVTELSHPSVPQGAAQGELESLRQRLQHAEAEQRDAAAAAEQLQQATAQVCDEHLP